MGFSWNSVTGITHSAADIVLPELLVSFVSVGVVDIFSRIRHLVIGRRRLDSRVSRPLLFLLRSTQEKLIFTKESKT